MSEGEGHCRSALGVNADRVRFPWFPAGPKIQEVGGLCSDMVRRPRVGRDGPDPATTFTALNDRTCRDLVRVLTEEPRTVKELSEAADVPLSTTYKKLDRLEAADLVAERTQLDPSGHHRGHYFVDVDRLVVTLLESGEFDVEVERRLEEPAGQLVDIVETVRRHT